MSEYQYYEFRAIDRPLDRAARSALRSVSSRAQITARRFTNHYEWGDFSGDPHEFMARWFDLHLYFANWGTRCLMIGLPSRHMDRARLAALVRDIDWVQLGEAGDNLILTFHLQTEERLDDLKLEDDSDWLDDLAPLRDELLAGDLGLFHLAWLKLVEYGEIADETLEPLPGPGPMREARESFAAFFEIDPDLVEAAVEAVAVPAVEPDARAALAAIDEEEKTALLLRVLEGDALVAAELKRRIRPATAPSTAPRRSVGMLRQRAQEIAAARARAEAERAEADRRRKAAEAQAAQRVRLVALRRRGEAVWREVEAAIERRNRPGYDEAIGLLGDLQAMATEDGVLDEFTRRIAALRIRHEKKGKFIERLAPFGGNETLLD